MHGKIPEGPHLDGDALCEYAEGAMKASVREAAEAHLRQCAECTRELEAVRGYFQDMASLEPVKAPPGFLAGVHARLPRPSPWKKALSRLWSPRGVPLQIAFLTLLGITAITAYWHQRGGLVSEAPAMLVLPEAATKAPASGASEKPEASAPAPIAAPEVPRVSADKDAAPPVSAELDAAPHARKKAANGIGAAKGASSGRQRVEEGYALSDAPIAKAKSGLADQKEGSAPRPDAFPQSTAAERHAVAAEPAPRAAPSAPQSGESVARSPAASGKMAARDADPRAEPYTGFAIRMKSIADTAAMLAGLRNMGAAIEPGQLTGEIRYVLHMPSSMLPDMRAYLERYGKAGYEGKPVPVVRDEKVSVYLRILRAGE